VYVITKSLNMLPINLLKRLLIFCLLALTSVTIFSQEKKSNVDFQPVEGQEGKNVPWIPTPQELVDKMLQLAKITPADYLIDLGSGDGRTVITAARRGTRALGIEYNPDLVKLSQQNAEKEGVSAMARFIKADIFEYDFSKATVITMFLLPEINMRLRSRLLNLKPGTRIVTNTFTMQEWEYDGFAKTGDEKSRWNSAYLWIVPAKVDGKWVLTQGGELLFTQEFQMLKGSLTTGKNKVTLTDGRLTGNSITFRAGGDLYTGVVNGNKMEGTITSGGNTKKWNAAR
jgi:precorrin-6B methylase 2